MKNPIQEWLLRVEAECGMPGAMMRQAQSIQHENTRLLLMRHARAWSERMLTAPDTSPRCDGCGCSKSRCDAIVPPAIKCCPDCRHETKEKKC